MLDGLALRILVGVAGPVKRLPKSQASTDQLVWMCSSPKYALRSGFFSCANAGAANDDSVNAAHRVAAR